MRKVLYIFAGLLFAGGVAGAQGNSSAVDYIDIYRQWISPLKGTSCRMYPSCSAYGKIAFESYPFFEAVCMTTDRLLRCGHEDTYPVSIISGTKRYIDPPDTLTYPVSSGAAYAEVVCSDSAELQFIASLINAGDYSSALLEAERLLFFDREAYASNPLLYSYKLKCYEGLGEYSSALRAFNSFPSSVRRDYRTAFTAAHIQALAGDTAGAVRSFSSLNVTDMPVGATPPYIELMILDARSGNTSAALENLSCIRPYDTVPSRYESAREILARLNGTSPKSPALAGVLGIFPGGGYAYLGQWKSALASLLVIGALGYSAYTSFDSRNYGVGALCAVIGVSFYFGNIFGAGKSARRINALTYNRAADELRALYPYID